MITREKHDDMARGITLTAMPKAAMPHVDMLYEVTSTDAKPIDAILWLTGWSMSPAVFDEVQRLMPDFRHFRADYSKCDTPDEMVAIAREAAIACRQSVVNPKGGQGRLIIAGWSLGGLIALQLAVEGVAQGLVMIGSTACFTRGLAEQDRGWPVSYIRQMKKALQSKRESTLDQFHKMMFTTQETNDGNADRIPSGSEWSLSALQSALQLLQTSDFRAALPELACPVLLLHGSEDRICPIGAAEEVRELAKHADLISFDGSGHIPFLGKEQQVAEAIRRWRDGQTAKRDPSSI